MPSSSISIHALLAESDAQVQEKGLSPVDFYPRSPCGERRFPVSAHCFDSGFLSTLSLRRATQIPHRGQNSGSQFLSTLSLRRATSYSQHVTRPSGYFYPRSPCGERRLFSQQHLLSVTFLSTLSLRRATFIVDGHKVHITNFYPRSPCGERPANKALQKIEEVISIHALLAESDYIMTTIICTALKFLSTLSLRRATFCRQLIHHQSTFLSTLSLRRATKEKPRQTRTDTNFYPRSPCGERLHLFASSGVDFAISIHALLAESDNCTSIGRPKRLYFYPRSPCGERLHAADEAARQRLISIHALLAESDSLYTT